MSTRFHQQRRGSFSLESRKDKQQKLRSEVSFMQQRLPVYLSVTCSFLLHSEPLTKHENNTKPVNDNSKFCILQFSIAVCHF